MKTILIKTLLVLLLGLASTSVWAQPDNSRPGQISAADDQYEASDASVLAMASPGVLANDSDSNGASLEVTGSDSTSANGAAVNVNADGSFSYNASASSTLNALGDGQSGEDRFSYTVSNGRREAAATVTITVIGSGIPMAMEDCPADMMCTDEGGRGVIRNDG